MTLHPSLSRIVGLLSLVAAGPLAAADWPMWRHDGGRTANSPEVLPPALHLQWTRQYPPRQQVWDDPLNHDLMPYDKVFEPVVLGDRMFVGFSDTDKVVALDIKSGAELWSFYTDGPVRFAPVAWRDKVFFTSDDGNLYCVDAANGKLVWKFRGGPSGRKVIGNERIISAWPARGGPVLRDDKIYFAASIWPFMGTFIYALDAATGKVAWVNDGTGAQFIKQPHNAPAFAGVAPQGALVATQDYLVVPGGRSVPAAFDRHTGEFKYFHIADGGKGNGGSFVVANDQEFFAHTRLRGVRAYELETGKKSSFTVNEPVLDGDTLYASLDDSTRETEQALSSKGPKPVTPVPPKVQAFGSNRKVLWEINADASGDLIKSGNRLYAAGAKSISAIELPTGEGKPTVVWSQPVAGQVLRLLAANGHLFAVTLDGRILAFGATKTTATTLAGKTAPHPAADAKATEAKAILAQAGTDEGYALMFGVGDGKLLRSLVQQSKFHIVAVDRDTAVIERLRREFDTSGVYGRRVAVHYGTPAEFMAPPYIANLVVIGAETAGTLKDVKAMRVVYDSVRPYGGTLWIAGSGFEQGQVAGFEKAVVKQVAGATVVVRDGALPGAADWTHQYGDVANTVKSDDARVRAPLGLLWFGGSSNMDVLPRHGHGPPEQVVGGRNFLQGMSSLSARDVYTGRVLWKRDFESLGTYGIYFNETYTNTPLSVAYNQKHIPGANGRGVNYIATAEAVYLLIGSTCHVLDARTGQTTRQIEMPKSPGEETAPDWGYIGIYEGVLIGGAGFAHFTQKLGDPTRNAANTIEDFSASAGLVGFDRHTGKLLWQVAAKHSFLHNGIVAGNGRVYALDKLPGSAEDKLKRRGRDVPGDYRIATFDVRTGKTLWEAGGNMFGTWLGYSQKHDLLLQAGAKASDRLKDEVGEGMVTYRGADGSVVWKNLTVKYTGPCILHNDLIITTANSYQVSSGALNLLDGTPHLITNPLTGAREPLSFSRSYGCNSAIASEHLLTFRSGAAGFYDLETHSGTANLGGFRSSCTANLVAADGVLNAPDYTRTCSCSYQNQTSLGLIHMPDVEMWTHSVIGAEAKPGERIHRVGINFGAPGDRRAADGTLWLEYPPVGGDSPALSVTVSGGKLDYFTRHSSQISGAGLAWVVASGVRDVETISIVPETEAWERTMISTKSSKDDEDGDEAKSSAKKASKTEALAAKSGSKTKKAEARKPLPPANYTVRLHFAEPDDAPAGQRVFGVALQGKPVLEKFDIASVAGGSQRGVVREFKGVLIERELLITFSRAPGTKAGPLLCGVELIAEKQVASK